MSESLLKKLIAGLVFLAFLTLGAAAGSDQANAQEVTPLPVTCDVEARPVSFIADLLLTPTPEVTPIPVTEVPAGIEVTDPVVREAAVRVVETLILCVNQGEILRSFSLFEDGYLRRIIDPEGLMSQDVAIEIGKSFATPEAVDEVDLTVLGSIISVRQMEDGAVVVIFENRGGVDHDPEHYQIDLFVLREIDGDWLIVDGLANIDQDDITHSQVSLLA